MTHLSNIPDSDVPATVESKKEVETSLHFSPPQNGENNCVFYIELLVLIEFSSYLNIIHRGKN